MISPEYAAGFFDGEGCVNLTVSGKSRLIVLRIMLVNTEPTILAAFQMQFGGHLQGSPQNKRAGWKPFRALVMSGHIAAAFLTDIAPYVRVKAAQVALALEFWEYKQRPKSQRCDYLQHGHGAFGRLKPEVLHREHMFKQHMHVLNAKGA